MVTGMLLPNPWSSVVVAVAVDPEVTKDDIEISFSEIVLKKVDV